MPVYEFACGDCGQRFDRLQAIGDAQPRCPACGGDTVTRLISRILGLASGREGSAPITSSGCGCGGACACGR